MFDNSGNPKVYLSSADFMTRNIENRVEVAVPIYDSILKQEIQDVFEIAWNDNVKARKINGHEQNLFVVNGKEEIRSQWKIYDYYIEKSRR
jgi:polyphosphate kinase